MMSPEREITRLSVRINIVPTARKFAAGIFGRSRALIADAIRSLSDFAIPPERALRQRFGKETIANLRLEPYSA